MPNQNYQRISIRLSKQLYAQFNEQALLANKSKSALLHDWLEEGTVLIENEYPEINGKNLSNYNFRLKSSLLPKIETTVSQSHYIRTLIAAKLVLDARPTESFNNIVLLTWSQARFHDLVGLLQPLAETNRLSQMERFYYIYSLIQLNKFEQARSYIAFALGNLPSESKVYLYSLGMRESTLGFGETLEMTSTELNSLNNSLKQYVELLNIEMLTIADQIRAAKTKIAALLDPEVIDTLDLNLSYKLLASKVMIHLAEGDYASVNECIKLWEKNPGMMSNRFMYVYTHMTKSLFEFHQGQFLSSRQLALDMLNYTKKHQLFYMHSGFLQRSTLMWLITNDSSMTQHVYHHMLGSISERSALWVSLILAANGVYKLDNFGRANTEYEQGLCLFVNSSKQYLFSTDKAEKTLAAQRLEELAADGPYQLIRAAANNVITTNKLQLAY